MPSDGVPDTRSRLELMIARADISQAHLRPREARLVGLHVAGFSREQMAELTGESYRTVDLQLGRVQRRLRYARRSEVRLG